LIDQALSASAVRETSETSAIAAIEARASPRNPRDLAGGVARQRQCQFVARNAAAIVRNEDALDATTVEAHLDLGCPGIETVLQKFLHHRRRPLDDFAGRDLADQFIVERTNRGARNSCFHAAGL
jgi:hypothetical protein